jgi:hypothetical protein
LTRKKGKTAVSASLSWLRHQYRPQKCHRHAHTAPASRFKKDGNVMGSAKAKTPATARKSPLTHAPSINI